MSTPSDYPRVSTRGTGTVLDYTKRQIERMLRQRKRYRYVRPRVVDEGEGFRIESPCCSRNVDPDGGVIDIAWLVQNGSGGWYLYSRDHEAHRWVLQQADASLSRLLELLRADVKRVFWP